MSDPPIEQTHYGQELDEAMDRIREHINALEDRFGMLPSSLGFH